MEKNRFKQLMESALGNVKPLINEQDMSDFGGFSNIDEYENKYSELVNKTRSLLSELESVASEFEEFSEELYSQIDIEGEDSDDEEGMETESYNMDIEDLAQSSSSYSELLFTFLENIEREM